MVFKTNVVALSLLSVALCFEAGAAVGEIDLIVGRASGDGAELDYNGLGGRFYPGELQDVDAPMDLHQFFQRANVIEVDFLAADSFLRKQRIGATYFLGDLSLAYNVRHLQFFDTQYHWTADVGYHVTDNFRVLLPGALLGFFDSDDGDFLDTDFSLKSVRLDYVHRMGMSSLLLGGLWIDQRMEEVELLQRIGFSLVDVLPSGTYLEARYYLRQNLGFGGFLHVNVDGDLDAINLGGSWWPERSVGLSTGLTFYTDDHQILPDITAFFAGVTTRF